jgi:hypothetical protein
LTAQALTGTAERSAAVRANLAYLRDSPGSALQVAQGCTAVGDAQTAISLLQGYYFGKGDWAELAPPGGDHDRYTAPLFMPPMRRLWNTLPFERLLEGIGLVEYWHSSRTLPDYRRVS